MVEWAAAWSFQDPVKPADGGLTCFIRRLFCFVLQGMVSRRWSQGQTVLFLESGGLVHTFLRNSYKEGAQFTSIRHCCGYCRKQVLNAGQQCLLSSQSTSQSSRRILSIALIPSLPSVSFGTLTLGSHCPSHWPQDHTLVKLPSQLQVPRPPIPLQDLTSIAELSPPHPNHLFFIKSSQP